MFVQEGGFKHIDGSSALTQELQACAATGWVAAGGAFLFPGFLGLYFWRNGWLLFCFIFLSAFFILQVNAESDLDWFKSDKIERKSTKVIKYH